MWTYMYKASCQNCWHENFFDRWIDTTDDAENYWVDAVIDLDFIWQKDFVCSECWLQHYSGDYDWYTDNND